MKGQEKKGKLVGEFEGFKVYAVSNPAKKSGRDRVTIQIEHEMPKEWRTSQVLGYTHTVAIHFEKERSKQR